MASRPGARDSSPLRGSGPGKRPRKRGPLLVKPTAAGEEALETLRRRTQAATAVESIAQKVETGRGPADETFLTVELEVELSASESRASENVEARGDLERRCATLEKSLAKADKALSASEWRCTQQSFLVGWFS